MDTTVFSIAGAAAAIVAVLKYLGIGPVRRARKKVKYESGQSTTKRLPLPRSLPSVPYWVGRSDELGQLQSLIFDPNTQRMVTRWRIIGLVGAAGIGKTFLASKLVRRLHEQYAPFEASAWVSLRPDPGTHEVPHFHSVADSLLSELSNGRIAKAITAQDDYREKTERMVALLRETRCLVVVDNVETVLESGDHERAGYFAKDCKEYAWLLREMGGVEHQSKVIVTSRESLAELSGPTYRAMFLSGLDQEAAVELLRYLELEASDEELTELANKYDGQPKPLELVASLIRDDARYHGDVGKFSRERKWLVIGDIDQLIDEMLGRLSNEERQCLTRISVYQTDEYPLSATGIAAEMPQIPEWDLEERIVQALRRRQLLDYDAALETYQMHPLVQEKAYRLLSADGKSRRTSHRRAHDYFISKDLLPRSEWRSVEDVKPLIRAHYHACRAADWELAARAIQTFGLNHLYRWSEFQLMRSLHKDLLPADLVRGKRKVKSPRMHARILRRLGIAHFNMGDFQEAVDYQKEALGVACEIQDRILEGEILNNLGLNYAGLGQYEAAADYYRQAMAIADEYDYKHYKAITRGNLGYILTHIGKFREAIGHAHEAVILVRQIGGEHAEADTPHPGYMLNTLGIAYRGIGEYQTAIKYHRESVAMAREAGEKRCEAHSLTSLGRTLHYRRQSQEALAYHRNAIDMAAEIGDKQTEARALNNMGYAYHSLAQYQRAIEYHERALVTARKIGFRRGEGIALDQWGRTERELGKYGEALEKLEQALSIYAEIGTRKDEAEALKELAETYKRQGDRGLARGSLERALAIAAELEIALAEECREMLGEIGEEGID